jgi:dipeptidase E
VVAIREGTALILSGGTLTLEDGRSHKKDEHDGFIFVGDEKKPLNAGADLTHLI